MKSAAKRAALGLLSSAPVHGMLRWRALRNKPLTVLCYHTLRPDNENLDAWLALRLGDFRRQLDILRRDYDIVSLDEGLEPARPGTRPRAVLTFDDGEWGLYEYLRPLVEAEGVPVTVYVATGQIESGVPYWFDRVMNALQREGAGQIDLTAAGLGRWTVGPARGKARWQVIGDILEALKAVAPPDREALAQDVVAQAGAGAGTGTDAFSPLRPMSVEQLRDLAASPHVTIGAHSHCHSLLDQIPLNEARDSIARSRELLRAWTGQPVRHFAYPNGNFSPALVSEMAALGFASASILGDRPAPPGSDPFALPRIGIGRYDGPERFRLRLVGI